MVKKLIRIFVTSCLVLFCLLENTGLAKNTKSIHAQQTQTIQGSVYPQFRCNSGIIHWLPEQMPLKVFVAHGQSMEKILDPALDISAFNVDNLGQWPDVAAYIFEHPEQIPLLPIADGFLPEHYQAAVAGISSWKVFEKEGLFSFVFTDDPNDADIYIFWVNHFVDKLGLALFANDIRGYTAKRSFWYKDIQAGKQPDFKPVITLLRMTTQRGESMPYEQMKASAAHEFGHALGIEGHSNNSIDLMSIYYGRGIISPNDAATIRYLYHLTPDLVP